MRWSIEKKDGTIMILEVRCHTRGELKGTCKAGTLCFHCPGTQEESRQTTRNFYANACQELWSREKRSLGVFLQFGHSPGNTPCDHYAGAGVNCTGPARESTWQMRCAQTSVSGYRFKSVFLRFTI